MLRISFFRFNIRKIQKNSQKGDTTMKKVMALILAACLCMPTLGSCVKPAEFSDAFETEETVPSLFPDFHYDPDLAQNLSRYQAAAAENGYYFIQRNMKHTMTEPNTVFAEEMGLLYYYDIDRDASILLCANTACRHQDKTCGAYLHEFTREGPAPGEWAANCSCFKVYYYKGYIYMLAKEENAESYLLRYDPDYTNEVKISCLTRAGEDPRILAVNPKASLIHDDWYYYMTFPFDEEHSNEIGRDIEFTFCRVKLEKGAQPEELYSFVYPADYEGFYATGSGSSFRILAAGDDIYCLAATIYRDDQTKNQVEQRLIRFRASEGASLLWEYSGNEHVNLLGAEGNGPIIMQDSVMDGSKTLYYLSNPEQDSYAETAVRSLNLETGESRLLYSAEEGQVISGLFSDGDYLFFREGSVTRQYLTAIDKQGKLMRKYCFEYTDEQEEHAKKMEANGGVEPIPDELKEMLPEDYEPEIPMPGVHGPELMSADSRYLMLRCSDSVFKELLPERDTPWGYGIIIPSTLAVGLINTEDFISGKDFRIKRIFAYGQ